MNVNCMSYVFVCMNTWSPDGGALGKFVEPSGGRALLEEVSHWGWALRLEMPTPLPVLSASWQLTHCDQTASCSYHHVFPTMRE